MHVTESNIPPSNGEAYMGSSEVTLLVENNDKIRGNAQAIDKTKSA